MKTSRAAQRQKPPVAIEQSGQTGDPDQPSHWRAVSVLRWRPGIVRPTIVLTSWSAAHGASGQPLQPAAQAPQGQVPGAREDQTGDAVQTPVLLPPLEMLRAVAQRWARVTETDEAAQPALIAFRSAGALAPAEVARSLPGATVRLYTLGGPVSPLPDTILAEPPLARYSVVRAPNMSFWPQLRALIEEQEREAPGMELWEDLEHDLAMLEQELAWWIASPQGLVLNLYEGDDLIGHLALARQRDETEGCDGWGIIALHIARRARGQRLGMLLQRVASTLIHTRRLARRARLAETGTMPAVARTTAAHPEATQRDAAQVTDLPQGGEPENSNDQSDVDQADMVQLEHSPESDASDWPYFFGFVAAQNLPALRGAYGAGRRIIGTYIDVPVVALESSPDRSQPGDSTEG